MEGAGETCLHNCGPEWVILGILVGCLHMCLHMLTFCYEFGYSALAKVKQVWRWRGNIAGVWD